MSGSRPLPQRDYELSSDNVKALESVLGYGQEKDIRGHREYAAHLILLDAGLALSNAALDWLNYTRNKPKRGGARPSE
jgi:hypothetical protein